MGNASIQISKLKQDESEKGYENYFSVSTSPLSRESPITFFAPFASFFRNAMLFLITCFTICYKTYWTSANKILKQKFKIFIWKSLSSTNLAWFFVFIEIFVFDKLYYYTQTQCLYFMIVNIETYVSDIRSDTIIHLLQHLASVINS